MGFFDRFRKKKKNADPVAKEKAADKPAAKAAPEAPKEVPLPTEPVPRAFALARRFNESNVEAGKYDRSKAALFEAQLAAIEASDAADDVKMVEVGQTRGGMLIAAMTVANAVKPE